MQWHYLILALRTIIQSDLCSRGQEAMHNFQAFLKSRLCFEIKLTTSFGMRQRPRTGISKLFHQEKRGKNISPSNRLVLCPIWFDFIRRTAKNITRDLSCDFNVRNGWKSSSTWVSFNIVWFDFWNRWNFKFKCLMLAALWGLCQISQFIQNHLQNHGGHPDIWHNIYGISTATRDGDVWWPEYRIEVGGQYVRDHNGWVQPHPPLVVGQSPFQGCYLSYLPKPLGPHHPLRVSYCSIK